MKIFVLGTERGDFFAHNVAYTLRKMGHDVISDPMMGSDAGKSRICVGLEYVLTKSSSFWALRNDKRAIAIVEKERPDLVIATTRTYEPETIEYIKQAGSLAICWYGDAPGHVQSGHITGGEYDAVFVKDKRFANDLHDVLGLNAYHLNEACNPDWHSPIKMPIESHIVAAGTMYGYRNRVLQRLINSEWEVKAFGPTPSPWVPDSVVKAHTGTFLDHRNKAVEFGRGFACLGTFAPAERDALNCRIFETCGCGGLLISEHKHAMDECFEPNKEYLPFSTFDELIEQLRRVKSDSRLGATIRTSASKRAHAEHSYEHRLRHVFKILDL